MNRQLTLINTNDSFWCTNNYKTWDKVYPTHLQKKDLVIYYISTPGWFMQKRPGNYIHINLVNLFPKQNKKHINKGCQHINFSSSVFLVLDWIVYQWEVEVQLSWIGLGLHCLQLGCLKIYPWLPASTSTSTIAINKSSIENQNNIDI